MVASLPGFSSAVSIAFSLRSEPRLVAEACHVRGYRRRTDRAALALLEARRGPCSARRLIVARASARPASSSRESGSAPCARTIASTRDRLLLDRRLDRVGRDDPLDELAGETPFVGREERRLLHRRSAVGDRPAEARGEPPRRSARGSSSRGARGTLTRSTASSPLRAHRGVASPSAALAPAQIDDDPDDPARADRAENAAAEATLAVSFVRGRDM